MAIIYTYPRLTNLEDSDLLLLSDSSAKRKPTMSVKLGDLATFINDKVDVGVTSIIPGTGITIDQPTGDVTISAPAGGGTVTGTGTTDSIVKFTDGPNGVVGDSTIIDTIGETQFTQDVLFNAFFQGDNGGAIDGQLDMISGGPVLFQDPAGPPTGKDVSLFHNGDFVIDHEDRGKINLKNNGNIVITANNNSSVTTLYNFGSGGALSSDNNGIRSFEFKANAGGFYKEPFIFRDSLSIDRASISTFPSLDVGTPTSGRPAAYFRNGVVVSNNPSGVTVDNTSVVIGAGNNDVVSGADNCLTVGNGNQILSNSDHSVALGLGNTISNNASASLVVGQGNTLDGTGLPAGTTARSYILGLNNNLTGSFASFIAGGNNNVTTEQNAIILGYNNTTNGLDNVFSLGESNTLNDASANGVFMIGNGITGQDGNMVLGFRNDTTGYPATDYANGLGNTKLVLSTGTVTNSNAIIITEGGVTRGGGTAQEPRIVMPSIVAFDYADDIAAAAAGIPVGGIYHNAGALRIRRP